MLHKRKNIVLLLGKMLCYVVNLTPLSSHLLSQKDSFHSLEDDIFHESWLSWALGLDGLPGQLPPAGAVHGAPGGILSVGWDAEPAPFPEEDCAQLGNASPAPCLWELLQDSPG